MSIVWRNLPHNSSFFCFGATASIPPEARNIGTYFIMSAMSETEIQRFKEVTLHPSSKLITRLPRATSFIFSPYFYPEPFFVKHRKIIEATTNG
jgi:hypothetical protein